MMLVHIEQPDIAERVHNAWLATIEDGVHTYDIYKEGVSTPEGRDEGVRRGRRRAPRQAPPEAQGGRLRRRAASPPSRRRARPRPRPKQETVGVDVYVGWTQPRQRRSRRKAPAARRPAVRAAHADLPRHQGLAGRPAGDVSAPTSAAAGSWAPAASRVTHADIVALLSRIAGAGLEFVMTENLSDFDGERGYSLGQGE